MPTLHGSGIKSSSNIMKYNFYRLYSSASPPCKMSLFVIMCAPGDLRLYMSLKQSLSSLISTGQIRSLQLLSGLLPSHFILFSMYKLRFNLAYTLYNSVGDGRVVR